MSQPRQLDHPLYHLLHNDDVKGFNAQKPKGVEVDLSGGDFRGLDLRSMDTDAVNFTDAYFRGADLRGLDFRNARIEGASLAHAQISGAYFPRRTDRRRDSHVGEFRHSPALSNQVTSQEQAQGVPRQLATTLPGRHAYVNRFPARMEAR